MDQGSRAADRAEVHELIRAGIRHAKSGDRARARELLERATALDEGRVAAWLWLSAVVDSAQEKAICLENVLVLDPEHAAARRGLEMLHTPAPEPPEAVARAEESDGVPPPPLWDEPPDLFLCPYCTSLTGEGDRRCPSCGGDLWMRMRRRDSHSVWLWNMIAARFSIGLLSALAPVVVLAVVAQRLIGAFEPFVLLPVYLGLPSEVAPDVARAALRMGPPAYLLPLLALSIYSFALLAGMYARWKPVYWLLVGGAVTRFGLSIAGMIRGQYYGLACGGMGVLASIGVFFVLLAVQDDFAWDRQRVYFRLDRRAQGGAARLERAGLFADLGMRALAVLHLRAAMVKMPTRVPVYVRLARAYLQLDRPDLAQVALHDAERIDPEDPAVRDLLAALEP